MKLLSKNRLPMRMHHHAYTTENHEVTRKFYEDVIGLPLVAMYVEREHLGGEWVELGHAFYGLADGSALAFFNFADPKKQAEWRAKTQSIFVHLSMLVDRETQLAIRQRSEEAAVEHETFSIEHGYCSSLYLRDPNGLLLEFTVEPSNYGAIAESMAATAHADMRRWMEGKRESNNRWRADEETATNFAK
jgi:glyoxylase I family protein